MLRCWFYLMFGFYMLFGFVLHRLVGLRLLRLCPFLVSEVEQEIYSARGFAPRPPQWVSPLDPDQGRAPGPFARFARCFLCVVLASCSVRRCHSSLLIPNSSFLTPRSSLFTPVFNLDKCLKKCYYTIVIKFIRKFSVLSERK